MNIKKALAQLIVCSLFFTGCSNYQVKSKTTTQPDQATIQQTMTKAQNDNNEIINKDYDYVLSNLGQPNITTYWADINKLNSIQDIYDLNDLERVDLLYFKNISTTDSDNSALYVGLDNETVVNVQSIDYVKENFLNDFYKSNIAINSYRDYDSIRFSDIKMKNLEEFSGVNYSRHTEIVGNNQCMYDAYFYGDDQEKAVEVFKLDNEDQVLCLFSTGDKITKVELVNYSDIKSEIKDILLKNQ